ncbi:hypothetical protein PCC6912_50630 [Chlorogloeopsis fritschii PCC 6912]|uniref:Uncharacterized protein n=1 Tax=Chlorogloeopsis fritschii PCC 6912 TaxID=211165 RepID=A0A3S1FBR7_CHLFR|nr:hypothetical protein [Chlorogloeopsis fritschii]RUR74885.1 hypothetical protein PCC6912_50630 [Chlorogloeopsis fritschii PCC 6912]
MVLTKSDDSKLVCFVMGAKIIRRYEPQAEMSVNNGFIYVGNYELSYSRMTQLEKEMMESLGWIEGDESWAFYA